MASITTVSLDFLEKLESDLKIVNNKNGIPSHYRFAGYVNGSPVGITRTATAQLGLNRGGQILQFLAGFYTTTTDASVKARIAKASAQVYNVFASNKILTSPTLTGEYKDTGMIALDPSAPSLLLGFMMLDKQGILDDSNFTSNCITATSYIRSMHIPRVAMKINQGLTSAKGDGGFQSMMAGENYRWETGEQNVATRAVNGISMGLGVMSLYSKMYNVSTYSYRYSESYDFHRFVATKWGTTYDSAGNEVKVTTSGSYAGTRLCLPTGGHLQTRGAFPSVGYSAFVAMAMELQAFAEIANTASDFSDINSVSTSHPLHIDALKILNYYRDRMSADGKLYELGAHRNYAGDASRFRDAWKADLVRRQPDKTSTSIENEFVNGSAGFDHLIKRESNPAMTAYAYSLMWVNPNHTLFTNIANKFAYPATGKDYLEIDYSKVGSSATMAQAFASTGEAAGTRVLSGLGIGMIKGLTNVQ